MTNYKIISPKFHPVNIEVKGTCKAENPFQADLKGVFEGPNGERLVIPGFYDGNETWRVNFSPVSEGSWTYTMISSNIDIIENMGEVECTFNENSDVHGGLKVNPKFPYHFQFEDGTNYFMMGYETNWLWALGFDDPELKKLNEFIDMLKAYGFNQVIMNVYAHDTGWCRGKVSEKDYGPPKFYPWEGTNAVPDHSRLNPLYFQNYDRVIRCLFERGIIAHLYFKVYNKMVNWPERNSPEDDMYFKYVTARYQAYPNILWDYSKESFHETDKGYINSRIDLVKENDAYKRLITVHDNRAYYADKSCNDKLDFYTSQQHWDFHTQVLLQRMNREWPIVNAEYGYEAGPLGDKDLTYSVGQNSREIIRRAYEIVMAGGYQCYYYSYTAWDIIDYSYIPKGYSYLKILQDFFTSINWWEFEPSPEVCCWSGKCLARKDKEYVVYIGVKESCVLNLNTKIENIEVFWINTHTGERIDGGLALPRQHEQSKDLIIFSCPFVDAPGILHIVKN